MESVTCNANYNSRFPGRLSFLNQPKSGRKDSPGPGEEMRFPNLIMFNGELEFATPKKNSPGDGKSTGEEKQLRIYFIHIQTKLSYIKILLIKHPIYFHFKKISSYLWRIVSKQSEIKYQHIYS